MADVLRTWRVEIAGVSQAETVAALPADSRFSVASLSSWESGTAVPAHGHIAALDRAYRAGGALSGLLWAMSTPKALPARTRWEGNYATDATSVWTWLRLEDTQVDLDAYLDWGPIYMRLRRPLGPLGVIVTSPASLPNPALVVMLDRPGWVDFGTGEVPDLLGIPVINGVRHIRLNPTDVPLVNHFVRRLRRRFPAGSDWGSALRRFAIWRHDLVDQALSTPRLGWRVRDLTSAGSEVGTGSDVPPVDYRRLRTARRLSLRETARAATELLPDIPVSASDIESCESGRKVRRPELLPRLDTVYGADGQACLEPAAVTELPAAWKVRFPAYWIGPVSVATYSPDGASAVGDVTVAWGGWGLRAKVRSGAPVGFRKSPVSGDEVEVHPPAGWRVAAWVGHNPRAVDANKMWLPIDDGVFDDIERTWSRILGRGVDDIRALLGGHL